MSPVTCTYHPRAYEDNLSGPCPHCGHILLAHYGCDECPVCALVALSAQRDHNRGPTRENRTVTVTLTPDEVEWARRDAHNWIVALPAYPTSVIGFWQKIREALSDA